MSAATLLPDRAGRFPCPVCAKGRSDRALHAWLNDENLLVAFCHRCGSWEREDRGHRHQAAPRPAPVPAAPADPRAARELWERAEPIRPGSIAARYLEGRGCRLPPLDSDLRWLPMVKHPTGHVGPALVAQVTNAETKEFMTVHRTWIQPDGRKAAVEPARLLWKGLPKAGGVIRLWPDDFVTTGLAVGEGVETMLSVAHAFTPVWACIDAGNLKRFDVLAGIESLTIAADHDEAGLDAATACAARWRAAGREVRIITPPTPGDDLNDTLLGAA